MLKQLIINNIVLVESADITFHQGFNVLSGETGAGKSAIMAALAQIAGARTDTSLIRHGTDHGTIEAVFDITNHPNLKTKLSESGINFDDDSDNNLLIIRREISLTGRNRTLINHQNGQLTLLRHIGEELLEIVGQHANQRLLDTDHHRQTVDVFGELTQLQLRFSEQWNKETQLVKELTTLKNSEAQRLRDIEVCRMEIEELNTAQIKDGEEEELFNDYTRLSNAEEITRRANEIHGTLSGDYEAIIPKLNQLKLTFDYLVKLDPSLSETFTDFKAAIIEIDEVSHTIESYAANIEYNPYKQQEINERLTLLNKIKRKYGPSVDDIYDYHEKSKIRLKNLEGADVKIEELEQSLIEISESNNKLAKDLTEKRLTVAKVLEEAMTDQLAALNMPKAKFFVELSEQKRTSTGDDRIEFFFAPNIGEKKIPIKESASGGELSRVMLALQSLLAGKEQIPTIVFDEIDANIGGETASVVGKKLQEVGLKHQVLCITHFPQVAKCAQHHIQISKREIDGRTITEVKELDKNTQKKELERMAGAGV